MRPIIFRGKRPEMKDWVYGVPVKTSLHYDITMVREITEDDTECELVVPESVGQFTGQTDIHGAAIYENDIVVWRVNGVKSTAPVIFKEGGFYMGRDTITGFTVYNDWLRGEYEIIGNTYDNPELLKEAK